MTTSPGLYLLLAMMMANSGATSGWYHDFLETPVQLRVGSLEINKNMLLWINDALMAVFFLMSRKSQMPIPTSGS